MLAYLLLISGFETLVITLATIWAPLVKNEVYKIGIF